MWGKERPAMSDGGRARDKGRRMVDGRAQAGEARRQRILSVSFFVGISLAVVTLYVLAAYLQSGEFGFPLDDAWIHQVYARNLGTRFEFSFFAGQPSAGSTSPLWAVLTGVGYALGMDLVWTLLLGMGFLAGSGWMAGRVTRHLTGDARLAKWIAPLCVMLEWHMVWAAASGMEIVLFVFLSLALVEAFFARRNTMVMGVIGGLLTLTRPEGVLLAGLVGVGLVWERRRELFGWNGKSELASEAGNDRQGEGGLKSSIRREGRLKSLIQCCAFGLVMLVVVAPYLYFNLRTSGTILPNTFYAKGAEYAELTAGASFFARWLMLYRQPMIGAQLLLVPGLIYGAYALARGREWGRLLPALWILVLPALYAWRLPVEYQFGRYMMPIIPFVIIYGLVGTAELFRRIPLRFLRRAWALTIAVMLVVFGALGAGLYAQSVGIVNCEMVAAAKWTRANVPKGALIAAHDIGAQGYFDDHPMLDLAGLVSPEVIPFIRDETRLKEWMAAQGARYAIFFPTWYPRLSADGTFRQVYSTECAVTTGMGEENLRVYLIQ